MRNGILLLTWVLATGACSADSPAVNAESALDAAIRDGTYRNINSVIVIRGDQTLFERYYSGADADTTHDVRSVGKTFAGTILGIAIADGHIQSVDERLGDIYDLDSYDNASAEKSSVTLKHLLTMTSGFDAFDFDPDSPGNEENMYPTADWVTWALNLPMANDRQPGEQWAYFTGGIVILGDILNRSVPGGLEAYADSRLFAPLGIRHYSWQHTPQRVANTAGGIQLTPRGFASFGQLYRDLGRWNGEQVVPESWVRESLTPTIATTVEGNDYGYLWWHKSYEVDGRQYASSYCSGNGGNKIFVFEEMNAVVVVTASAYGQRYMHSQVDDMMESHILPMLIGSN